MTNAITQLYEFAKAKNDELLGDDDYQEVGVTLGVIEEAMYEALESLGDKYDMEHLWQVMAKPLTEFYMRGIWEGVVRQRLGYYDEEVGNE